MAPSSSNKLVLCQLEDNLRIAASDGVYVLQERMYDKSSEGKYCWKDRYYSGWVGGILRIYVLYSLQRFARTDVSGNIKHLIEEISKLEDTIQKADTDIVQLQTDYAIDPVELAILKDKAEDPIEQHIQEGL